MISFTDCIFEELCLLLAILLLSLYIYCVRTGTSMNNLVNLEALLSNRPVLRVMKKVPPTPPNTPSKDRSKSPDFNSSATMNATTAKSPKECVDTCPEIPCPQVDEEISVQPVGDVESTERKQICSGCPDIKPCPRQALEPSALLSETNLDVVSETPKPKSALADGSKSKLPLSVSIQLAGDSGGEKSVEKSDSSLEKVKSWQMAPPSQNVLFLPKFVESKHEEQAIPEEASEIVKEEVMDSVEKSEEQPQGREDAEIKAEETEATEEKTEEPEETTPAAAEVTTEPEIKAEETEATEEKTEEPEDTVPAEVTTEPEVKTEATEEKSEEPEDAPPAADKVTTEPEETAAEGAKPEEIKTKLEEPEPGEPEKTKPGECKGIIPTVTVTTLDPTCPSGICVSLPPCLLPHPKDQLKDQPCAESPPVVYIIIKPPDPCNGCSSGQAQQPPIESVPAEPVPEPEESTCICSTSPCPKEGTTESSAVAETPPKPTLEKTPTESGPTEEGPISSEDTGVEPPFPDEVPIEKSSPVESVEQPTEQKTKTEEGDKEAPVELASVIPEPAPAGDISAETTEPPAEEEKIGIEEVPVEETPAEEIPVEEATVGEPVTEEEKSKTDEAPVEETPAEEVTTEEPPVEEAANEEVPAEEVPKEEIPAEEVPKEEIPAEEVPKEEIPTE